MLLDGLRSLFLQALRFDGNDATVLVTRWNEEIDYIQSVFDNMTSKKPKPPIRTNADGIRAMTDDELAEWGATLPCCPPGPDLEELCYPQNFCENTHQMRKCWLNWLKQEVTE